MTDTAASSSSPAAPTGPTASTGGSWPAGSSGWTVVLASVPSQSEAQSDANRAAAAGLADTRVLYSSDHSSLRAGWWVAFSGVLSHDDAVSRASQAHAAGFPDAYPRYVSAG